MKYLTSRLIRDIEDGGIIFAPRRSGKSQAILALLMKSEYYVVVCPNKSTAENYIYELKKKGYTRLECSKQVRGPRSKVPSDKRVIIDEFMWNPFFFKNNFIKYHAAVSSVPVKAIMYDSKGRRLTLGK